MHSKYNSFFSLQLQKALRLKYKKIPYATTFARNFNLSTKGKNTISSETARRWMHGTSKPKIDTIEFLSHWLNVSPSFFFNGELHKDEKNFINNLNGDTKSFIQTQLLNKYNGLNKESLLIIFNLMDDLKGIQKNLPILDSELSDLKAEEILSILKNK